MGVADYDGSAPPFNPFVRREESGDTWSPVSKEADPKFGNRDTP
jgi:hypothetical protein